MPNVVLFGGSFNPVHFGHVFATCYLAHFDMFDEVLVVPVYKHPYDKSLVEYHHRYEMCRLAMSWIPKVTISDVEKHLSETSSEPSFTARTVSYLKKIHPDWELSFAVGSDNDVENWTDSESLLELASPFVIGRSGHIEGSEILPDVSSTTIREAIKGTHISLVEKFLPERVLNYINTIGLYR